MGGGASSHGADSESSLTGRQTSILPFAPRKHIPRGCLAAAVADAGRWDAAPASMPSPPRKGAAADRSSSADGGCPDRTVTTGVLAKGMAADLRDRSIEIDRSG